MPYALPARRTRRGVARVEGSGESVRQTNWENALKNDLDISDFSGSNLVLGKGQPEYLPLPAHRNASGMVTTCWKLTLAQRVRLLFSGTVWMETLTCGHPFQPQMLTLQKPDLG
jgi:hypothetical protein